MDWARILAYVTGTVDQELLARNEYLWLMNATWSKSWNISTRTKRPERTSLSISSSARKGARIALRLVSAFVAAQAMRI